MTVEDEVMTPGQILDDQLREQGCYALVVPRAVYVMQESVTIEVTKGKRVIVTYRPGHDLYDVELVRSSGAAEPRTVSLDDQVYFDELVPIIRARLHEYWA